MLEALKTNSTLCVLDIRSNPLVGKVFLALYRILAKCLISSKWFGDFSFYFTDKVLIKTIIEKVLMTADGQSPEVSVCS